MESTRRQGGQPEPFEPEGELPRQGDHPRSQGPGGEQAQLSAEETRRVLARAAELERSASAAAEPTLDLREVERIATEAGLSREAIQQAFVELRTGELEPKARPGLIDKLIGPEGVSSQLQLDRPPEEVRKKLHALLKQELLHPEERKGARTVWSATPGLWATIQRGLNWQGQSSWRQGRVVSQVTAAPPGVLAQSIVKLEAIPGQRKGMLVAAVVPALTMLPVAVMSAFAPHAIEQGVPFIVGGMAVATTGFVWGMVRFSYRQRLRSLRIAVERVLERLSAFGDDSLD